MPEFDRAEGVRLKAAGMDQAATSAGPEFSIQADELLRTVALNNEFLTADDLRRACADAGVHYQGLASGAALKNGAIHGYYRDTGRRTVTDVPAGHARGLVIWESLIFTGQRAYGLAKLPMRRWALKAEGLPALVFKERATALEWISTYMQACGIARGDADMVKLLPWKVSDDVDDPMPGE